MKKWNEMDVIGRAQRQLKQHRHVGLQTPSGRLHTAFACASIFVIIGTGRPKSPPSTASADCEGDGGHGPKQISKGCERCQVGAKQVQAQRRPSKLFSETYWQVLLLCFQWSSSPDPWRWEAQSRGSCRTWSLLGSHFVLDEVLCARLQTGTRPT